MLRALPGKHEGQLVTRTRFLPGPRVILCHLRQITHVTGGQHGADWIGMAVIAQRQRNRVRVGLRMGFRPMAQILHRLAQRLGAGRRQREQTQAILGRFFAALGLWPFAQNHMHIRTTHPKRGDACNTRPLTRGPVGQFRRRAEG